MDKNTLLSPVKLTRRKPLDRRKLSKSATTTPTPTTGNPASQTHRKKHSTPDNLGLDHDPNHASGPPSLAISFYPLSSVWPSDF